MNKAIIGAACDDRKGLKNDLITYIVKDRKTETIRPPILREEGKSVRGFAHKRTARLLCPQSLLAEFNADPR
jgi:hypothetical protein